MFFFVFRCGPFLVKSECVHETKGFHRRRNFEGVTMKLDIRLNGYEPSYLCLVSVHNALFSETDVCIQPRTSRTSRNRPPITHFPIIYSH